MYLSLTTNLMSGCLVRGNEGMPMKTALDLIPVAKPASLSQKSVQNAADCCAITLQPSGYLRGIAVLDFQSALENALEGATQEVILDLQEVEAVAKEGIAAIVNGLELAAILGKSLALQALDGETHTALTLEWQRSQQISFGPWGNLFDRNFEEFLRISPPNE